MFLPLSLDMCIDHRTYSCWYDYCCYRCRKREKINYLWMVRFCSTYIMNVLNEAGILCQVNDDTAIVALGTGHSIQKVGLMVCDMSK